MCESIERIIEIFFLSPGTYAIQFSGLCINFLIQINIDYENIFLLLLYARQVWFVWHKKQLMLIKQQVFAE
jgi:hypothetical protein